MMAEMGARRRRLREVLGNYGQGLAEFLVMGGLLAGSLGLFFMSWGPEAAPWGFAVPFVFIAGFLLIEWRRQRAVDSIQLEQGAHPDDEAEIRDAIASRHDWGVFLLAFGCALAGVAALVLAAGAEPQGPPPEYIWTPPPEAVSSDMAIPPPDMEPGASPAR